jgi:hypothetical protein
VRTPAEILEHVLLRQQVFARQMAQLRASKIARDAQSDYTVYFPPLVILIIG